MTISTEIIFDLGGLFEIDSVTLGTHTWNPFDNGGPNDVVVSFSTTGTAPGDFVSPIMAIFTNADVPGDGHHDLPAIAAAGTSAAFVKLAFDGGGILGGGNFPPNKWMLDEVTIEGSPAPPPAVPEPSSILVALLGLTAIAALAWRKRWAQNQAAN